MTIFMTTHYMDEAENCDSIAIIDYGKIITVDNPENLKKQIGGNLNDVFYPWPDEISVKKNQQQKTVSENILRR